MHHWIQQTNSFFYEKLQNGLFSHSRSHNVAISKKGDRNIVCFLPLTGTFCVL